MTRLICLVTILSIIMEFKIRLLKIVSAAPLNVRSERSSPISMQYSNKWSEDETIWSEQTGYANTSDVRWKRESTAYAQLLHRGLSDAGMVPGCFGWFQVGHQEIAKMQALPLDTRLDGEPLSSTNGAPALVFEYLEGAERLSGRYLCEAVAEEALRVLQTIHSAYIFHGDTHSRNILIAPARQNDGTFRVVWTDFDNSACLWDPAYYDTPPTRRDLLTELSVVWSLFYHYWVSRIVYSVVSSPLNRSQLPQKWIKFIPDSSRRLADASD